MKLLGITDERTTCECCGKANLKRTVAIQKDSGEVAYFGSNCAAFALYGRKSAALARSVEEMARAVKPAEKTYAEMTDAEIDADYLAYRMRGTF